ncbi:hypothetical protein ECPA49_3247, partial [Escherichia coli PA49]
MHPDFS